ncbi:MAG: hypothetical protein ACSHX0_03795 [Akkermansiaceae bacterium]
MTIPAVHPEKINDLAGVAYHFQADRDFQKIYETNSKAGDMCDLASLCLKFAGNIGTQGGLGSLDRMVATSENDRFMLFSLYAKNIESPGPRIFGITTEISSDIKKMAAAVTEFI